MTSAVHCDEAWDMVSQDIFDELDNLITLIMKVLAPYHPGSRAGHHWVGDGGHWIFLLVRFDIHVLYLAILLVVLQ